MTAKRSNIHLQKHAGGKYVFGLTWRDLNRTESIQDELEKVMDPLGATHGVIADYDEGKSFVGVLVPGKNTPSWRRVAGATSAAAAVARGQKGVSLYAIALTRDRYWILGCRRKQIDQSTDIIVDAEDVADTLSMIIERASKARVTYDDIFVTDTNLYPAAIESRTLDELLDRPTILRGLEIRRLRGAPVERYMRIAIALAVLAAGIMAWDAYNEYQAQKLYEEVNELVEVDPGLTEEERQAMAAQRRLLMTQARDQALAADTQYERPGELVERCWRVRDTVGLYTQGWELASIQCSAGEPANVTFRRERRVPSTFRSLAERFPAIAYGAETTAASLVWEEGPGQVIGPMTFDELEPRINVAMRVVSNWQRLGAIYDSLTPSYSTPVPKTITFVDPEKIAQGIAEQDARTPIDADLMYSTGNYTIAGVGRGLARNTLPDMPGFTVGMLTLAIDQSGTTRWTYEGIYYVR